MTSEGKKSHLNEVMATFFPLKEHFCNCRLGESTSEWRFRFPWHITSRQHSLCKRSISSLNFLKATQSELVRGRTDDRPLAWQADMTAPKLSIAYLLNTANTDIDTPSSFFSSSESTHVVDPTSSDDSSIEPKTLQSANRKRKWDACCATTTTSTSSTSTDRSLHAPQDCQTVQTTTVSTTTTTVETTSQPEKKRPLRRYSEEILDCLIASYEVNSRPCEDTLILLANQLDLSPYQVKTW